MSKLLKELLKNLDYLQIYGEQDLEVDALTDDSRKVQQKTLFVAIKGAKVDSHKFISDVISQGACVIVGEENPSQNLGVTYIQVKDSRLALGVLASEWYDNPSLKLKVIGVTGTDGKTTTSNLIYEILISGGKKVGLISTINAQIGAKQYDTGLHVTNPEPLLLQKLLSEMVVNGNEYAVLEVTSHGIDQKRIAGVTFDCAVLTNITHEHLDYHKTFENYRNTKAKLFSNVNTAVLNADDPSCDYIKTVIQTNAKVITYSLNGKGTLNASKLEFLEDGMQFMVHDGKEKVSLSLNLLGEYNVYNSLAAISVTRSQGINWDNIKKALASFNQLSGRLERIDNDLNINLFVDFAHTPNALDRVLTLLNKNKKGKLIAVFGCAGERDIQKRKLMPKISVKLADVSIFTAEDPRTENIVDILSVMAESARLSGAIEIDKNKNDELEGNKHYFIRIPERGEAIHHAINKVAKRGDTVVICGKGHEKSMSYDGVEYPWSDQDAVRRILTGELPIINRK